MAFDRSIIQQPLQRVWSNPDIEWMRIPSLPQQIILTDRDDGTLWLLSHSFVDDPGDGFGRISINDEFSTGFGDYEVFGPYEGPVIPGPENDIVLLVRGGYLGYELRYSGRANAADRNLRVLTRRGTYHEANEINTPSTWKDTPDVLGWSPVEIP